MSHSKAVMLSLFKFIMAQSDRASRWMMASCEERERDAFKFVVIASSISCSLSFLNITLNVSNPHTGQVRLKQWMDS